MKISKYKSLVRLISDPNSKKRVKIKCLLSFTSRRELDRLSLLLLYASLYTYYSFARKYSRAFLFVSSFFSFNIFPFLFLIIFSQGRLILNFEESFIGLFYLKDNYSILYIHIPSFDLTSQWQKFIE